MAAGDCYLISEIMLDTLAALGSKKSEDVASRLAEVDWSFEGAKPSPTDKLHPYPAKFIGEIPRALLKSLVLEPGSTILDPFCGSGTTLAEAQRLGFRSLGIDLNPIACLLAEVRTLPRPAGVVDAAHAVAHEAEGWLPAAPVDIPNVDHWFDPDVKEIVNALTARIASVDNPSVRRVLRLALSSILVRVSRQESDTRYAAIDKGVTRQDVLRLYLAAVKRIDAALQGRGEPTAEATVLQGNTLAFTPDQLGMRFDAVITSPPYPNAYEYWLYHKYRMWWLGHDPIAVRTNEIGARPKYFSRNAATAETFAAEIGKVMSLCVQALNPRGYVCVVVGRSRIKGVDVDNAAIIERTLQQLGLSPVFRTERLLASSRKSFNLSHAAIKSESVLVYQNS